MASYPVLHTNFRYVEPLVLICEDGVKRTFFGESTSVDAYGTRIAHRHGWTDEEIAAGQIVGRLNTITLEGYKSWPTNVEMERLCRAQFEPKRGRIVENVCDEHQCWPCDVCNPDPRTAS